MTSLHAFLKEVGAARLSSQLELPLDGSSGPLGLLCDRLQTEIDSIADETRFTLEQNWPEFQRQSCSGMQLLKQMSSEGLELDMLEEEANDATFLPTLISDLTAHVDLVRNHSCSSRTLQSLTAILDFHASLSQLAHHISTGALPLAVSALAALSQTLHSMTKQPIMRMHAWEGMKKWMGEEEARLQRALVDALETCFVVEVDGEGLDGRSKLIMRRGYRATIDSDLLSIIDLLDTLDKFLRSRSSASGIDAHIGRIAQQFYRYFIVPLVHSKGLGVESTVGRAQIIYSEGSNEASIALTYAPADAPSDINNAVILDLQLLLSFFGSHSTLLDHPFYAPIFTAHLTPLIQSLLISHHLLPSLPCSASDLGRYLSTLASAANFEESFLTKAGYFSFLTQSDTGSEESSVIRSWISRIDVHWSRRVEDSVLERIRGEIWKSDWESAIVEILVDEEDEQMYSNVHEKEGFDSDVAPVGEKDDEECSSAASSHQSIDVITTVHQPLSSYHPPIHTVNKTSIVATTPSIALRKSAIPSTASAPITIDSSLFSDLSPTIEARDTLHSINEDDDDDAPSAFSLDDGDGELQLDLQDLHFADSEKDLARIDRQADLDRSIEAARLTKALELEKSAREAEEERRAESDRQAEIEQRLEDDRIADFEWEAERQRKLQLEAEDERMRAFEQAKDELEMRRQREDAERSEMERRRQVEIDQRAESDRLLEEHRQDSQRRQEFARAELGLKEAEAMMVAEEARAETRREEERLELERCREVAERRMTEASLAEPYLVDIAPATVVLELEREEVYEQEAGEEAILESLYEEEDDSWGFSPASPVASFSTSSHHDLILPLTSTSTPSPPSLSSQSPTSPFESSRAILSNIDPQAPFYSPSTFDRSMTFASPALHVTSAIPDTSSSTRESASPPPLLPSSAQLLPSSHVSYKIQPSPPFTSPLIIESNLLRPGDMDDAWGFENDEQEEEKVEVGLEVPNAVKQLHIASPIISVNVATTDGSEVKTNGDVGEDGWGFVDDAAEEVKLSPALRSIVDDTKVDDSHLCEGDVLDAWGFDEAEEASNDGMSPTTQSSILLEPFHTSTDSTSMAPTLHPLSPRFPTPEANISMDHIDDGDDDLSGWGVELDLDDSVESAPEAFASRLPQHKQYSLDERAVEGGGFSSELEQREKRVERRSISIRSKRIIGIAEEVLDQVRQVTNPQFPYPAFAASSAPLLRTFVSISVLYRAIAPIFYETMVNDVPALGMQLANDYEWIGEQYEIIWRNVEKTDVMQDGSVAVDAAVLRMKLMGREMRGKQIEIQQNALMEILDDAHRFLFTGDEVRYTTCERAVKQATYTLERLSTVWKPIMNPTAFYTTLGVLVNSVLTRVLTEIEDQSDISEQESIRLNSLCKILHGLEKLFMLDEKSSCIGREVGVWFKFVFLSELLEASMADILFLFNNGHLVDFLPQEIAKLVRALFSESPLRQKNIEHILIGHPIGRGEEQGGAIDGW